MKKLTSKIIGGLILGVFILPINTFAATNSSQENIFYFFKNVYGYSDFKSNYKKIDIVAPQIYEVGYDLKVSAPKEKKLIREAKRKKVATMPLLVQKSFDKVLMSDILLNQKAQDEIIQYMVDEAEEWGYVGWQFDFENINHLDREMYNAFVAKTYARMKAENLKFSVAVIVRDNDYDPNSKNQDWSSAYDYKELAKHSDFLSLMTYDDPRSEGPVASIPYVERILKYMTTQAPAEKMSLGIPLYCWHWQDDVRIGSTTYNLATKYHRKGKDREKGFDEKFGAEYFRYTSKGVENEIWCDSDESVKAKQEIVDKYGLRGFSAWALGQGDKSAWKVL